MLFLSCPDEHAESCVGRDDEVARSHVSTRYDLERFLFFFSLNESANFPCDHKRGISSWQLRQLYSTRILKSANGCVFLSDDVVGPTDDVIWREKSEGFPAFFET
uniref:Uncharacterized protein n=1 Tax=Rhipicephalus zambeziensis TaxID=60191 RepID=A0A224Y5G0_9ACAR